MRRGDDNAPRNKPRENIARRRRISEFRQILPDTVMSTLFRLGQYAPNRPRLFAYDGKCYVRNQKGQTSRQLKQSHNETLIRIALNDTRQLVRTRIWRRGKSGNPDAIRRR